MEMENNNNNAFCPQTFLARKNPHSTVWVATRLPNHLTTRRYTAATTVPSTVQRIRVLMDPPPRVSPHVLFGDVRIYSKRMEHECRELLIVLRRTTRRAPAQSINLQETFQDCNRDEDFHLKNPEEIILTDRISAPTEHCEDITTADSSPTEVLPNSGTIPMGDIPQSQLRNVVAANDHAYPKSPPIFPNLEANGSKPNKVFDQGGTSNAQVCAENKSPNSVLHGSPPKQKPQRRGRKRKQCFDEPKVLTNRFVTPPQAIEVRHGLRHCCHDPNNDYNLENPAVFQNLEDIDAESKRVLDQTMNEMDHVPEGMFASSQQHFDMPTPLTNLGGASYAQACVDTENNPPPSVHSPPQATLAESIERVENANNDYNLENPQVFPSLEDNDAKTTGDTNNDSNPRNSQAFPSLERIRAANNDYNVGNSLVFQNLEDNDAVSNRVLDQTTNERDHVPGMVSDLDNEGMSAPSKQPLNLQTPPTSHESTSNVQARDDENNPPIELHESPPIQQPQCRERRRRRRIQLIDEPSMLTNRFMSNALHNTRDIKRKKRNNRRGKEHIFYQPLLTGLAKDLLNISKSEYVSSRPHLVISKEDHAANATNQTSEETIAATSPVTAFDMQVDHARNVAVTPLASVTALHVRNVVVTAPALVTAVDMQVEHAQTVAVTPLASVTAFDMEVEHAQNVAVTPPALVTAVDMQVQHAQNVAVTPLAPVTAFDMEVERARNVAVTPPPPTFPAHNVVGGNRSPDRRDELTMASAHNASVASWRTNIASEGMQKPDLTASHGAHRSETMQTPDSDSDTQQLINSAKTDELWYLTMDSSVTSSSRGTSGRIDMTWDAAQYLKRLSPFTPEDPALMFFEVLVLKTNELANVQQEEPYGDASFKLAPTP